MWGKVIKVSEEVYYRLSKVVKERKLKSFREAIEYLLNRYEGDNNGKNN